MPFSATAQAWVVRSVLLLPRQVILNVYPDIRRDATEEEAARPKNAALEAMTFYAKVCAISPKTKQNGGLVARVR